MARRGCTQARRTARTSQTRNASVGRECLARISHDDAMRPPPALQHWAPLASNRVDVAEANVAAHPTPLKCQAHAIEHLRVTALDQHHVTGLHNSGQRPPRLPWAASTVDDLRRRHPSTPGTRMICLEAVTDDDEKGSNLPHAFAHGLIDRSLASRRLRYIAEHHDATAGNLGQYVQSRMYQL